jgi:zinc protease
VPNELDRVYKSIGRALTSTHTPGTRKPSTRSTCPANRMEQWAVIESERFQRPVFRLFQTELEAVYEEMNRALDNKQRIITEAVDNLLYKKHPYGQQPTLGRVEHLKNPSLKNITKFYETYYVPNNMSIFISGDFNTEETIKGDRPALLRVAAERRSRMARPWERGPLNGREFVE